MPIKWNVPKLPDDAGQTLSACQKLERRIVWNLLAHLKAAGWVPLSVNCGPSGEYEKVAGALACMRGAFALADDASIVFANATEPDTRRQWVLLVFGNGVDVVSDYTCGNASFVAAMESFSPEDCE